MLAGPAVRRGMDWLGAHFRVQENFPKGLAWKYYGLSGLGRVIRFSGRTALGTRDWYAEGAHHLVAIQRPGGGWRQDATVEQEEALATSFAILFLCSGRDLPAPPGRDLR